MRNSIIFLFFFLLISSLLAQDNDVCLDCHSDPEITTETDVRRPGLFVDGKTLAKSVHEGLACVDCHSDVDPDDLPHDENLQPVYCGECHDDVQVDFDISAHGQALTHHQPYAPDCAECHGTHDILSPKNPKAPSYKINVPFLCGKCHKEGAPVARVYNITEHNILSNYSQSIHGEGMFKKGLIVAAACVDCHTAHRVLPHTNPLSSTAPRNVAKTCMVCHSRIADVHVKVIEGRKWKGDMQEIPACTDCHIPHKARKESMTLRLSDRSCLQCHADKNVHKKVEGKVVSLFINRDDIQKSVHAEISCVKCHADVNPQLQRPCATAQEVNCASCHELVSEEYAKSGHGKAYASGIEDAPRCITCHGTHSIKSGRDETSPTYKEAIAGLCGKCHSKSSKVKETKTLTEPDAYTDYSTTIHGRSLGEKGFLSTATCTDCHSNHLILGHDDKESTIYPKNIPATCAACHKGIYNQYAQSVHSINKGDGTKNLPTCENCHTAHGIQKTDKDKFVTEVTHQCGECHKKLASTYLQTLHGETYQLGSLRPAKCSDCHGAHKILGPNHPNSTISPKNIVTTCRKCHDDANMRFTGYLTHATHHDETKYPILFYTYWAMTILLISVFGFFGIHTILWLPRSVQSAVTHKKQLEAKKASGKNIYYIRRFSRSQRITHLFVIGSFLALAFTGMLLKFSGMAWAKFFVNFVGGAEGSALIHRIAAITTFGYFFFHIFSMLKKKKERNTNIKDFLFGKDSMMFRLQDLKDFGATIKWFLGMGPRPDYGRWTYWEKFDYFAVFWGVFIIGFSGLMLWFPEFFTLFLPGWLINVSHIVHSDEALLAVGFIFTIHFFNTHLRPESFPMDTAIFTGLIPLDEFRQTRARQYEELKKSGKLRKVLVKKDMTARWEKLVKIFGSIALAMGILIIILIIYSMLFGYK